MQISLSAAVAAALFLLTPLAQAAAPVVSNISAVQRAGTQLVDITYDVTADTSAVWVGLEISSDNGTTLSVPATTVSGAVGNGVMIGTGKVLTWNAGADWSKQYTTTMCFKVTADDLVAPAGFSTIPAGSFQMGDAVDGMSDAPIRPVTVSAFYMGRNLVTKAEWDTVRTWGLTHGYTDLADGAGKAATHPVQTITWFDMVKWCNARSEKEGLTPCYTASGIAYRTGSSAPDCNWSANGYRLPSEAEWEKAARGGLSGKRFPWGYTISQSQANYFGSTSSYSYDSGPNGYNSIGSIGGTSPATSPVGSFAANGYGLYDMAGNVWEYCWDWYGAYAAGAQTDPWGVSSGLLRVLRGGAWYAPAGECRVAYRGYGSPPVSYNFIGFRVARCSVAASGFAITSNVTVDTRSSVSTLSALALSSGTLTPTFMLSTKAYTTGVTNATTSMTVTPTVTDATATIKVNGTTVTSGTASASIPLVVGVNTITVLVTAQDGTTTSAYTITVTRASLDCNVRAAQRSGTKLVDIDYDIIGINTPVATSLTISADGGVTWTVPATTLSGAIGNSVTPGTNLRITWNAGEDWNYQTSTRMRFRISVNDLAIPPADFSQIPGGSFIMGDALDGLADAPVHTVNVSAFTMQKKGVTKADWDGVREWGLLHGYTDLAVGAGKAINHPVQTVSWYDVVKWCNARSEMEGLTPCYYTDAAQTSVYRTGNSDLGNTLVKWVANGYRLPTEAEWEKAARGGLSGKRFPWGDTISHSEANFYNSGGETYQNGTTGYHPTYYIGASPYTSPVGSLTANDYGVYDMAGNVWDWCWDWYGPYVSGVQTDPRGAVSGSYRAARGGGWNSHALLCLVALRSADSPGNGNSDVGFRPGRVNFVSAESSNIAVNSGIAGNLLPGLDVRAWQGTAVIEGPQFDLPGTPTHSTTAGTLGYATGAIHLGGGVNHEHFASTDSGSSGVLIGPLPNGYQDNFTVEYRGKLYIANAGTYRIATTSDDGSALWIDPASSNPAYSTASVQNNFSQSMTQRASGQISLGAGYHDIIVRYYEVGGLNGLCVQWDPTGGTAFVDIPGENLYHGSPTPIPETVPLPVTNSASGVTFTTATLNGTVNPSGFATSAQFEYGLTTSYGNMASVTLSPNNGWREQTISASVSGLQQGATYHYRLTATNGAGTGLGEDMSFTVPRMSAVSTLSGMALSSATLSPAFSTGTLAYTASVPNAITGIKVTPTVTDPTATVKVNGTTVASGADSATIPLAVGSNTITVLVTAQDGTTQSSYTVTVTRISSVSTLSALALSSGALSPAFSAAIKTYTASVLNTTTGVKVTPTVTSSTATVTVNGNSVTSGTASASIPLVVGVNTITVLVTAQDGTTTSAYTVTVTRFSADASLVGLTLSSGSLSPTFAAGTLAYTASVANATTSVTVTPMVSNPAETVKVNGVSVAPGNASAPIPVAAGSNTITVLVTAQDPAFTTTYSVTVMRPPLIATFSSATTVPVTVANYTATGNEVVLSLGYAPTVGTNLTLVRNTGLAFITGRFSNLIQGQVVTLPYSSDTYRFVANYYGGTGNDLVLQWLDNKAYSWGSNSLGQLGNTDSASSSVPIAVTTADVLADKTLVSMSVGASHSVALCSDGTVATWGNNIYGQLGDGTNNNSNVPVAITSSGALANKTIVGIAAGFNHSLALCSDGTVVAWGFNSSGQIGNNTVSNSNVPVAVTRSSGTALYNKAVVAIAAGYNHNLARCADGAVVAWGNNAYGQLGNNTINNSKVPVNITASGELNGRTVVCLVGGSDHSMALCSDGSLVSWGRNNYGQLGNGSLVNSSIPVVVDASDVLSGKVITTISAGGWHTLALCSDGTLAAFGRNNNGQLGNNGTTDSSVPVRVITATGTLFNKTIMAIGGSNAHSLALCSDGTLAAWGSNNNGQLGNDITITSSSVPIAVTRSTLGSGEKFTDLATGSSASHVMALAAFHVSSNSTLAGLALSSGSLSPGFVGGTTSYAASVPNATASVTVTPTVAEANATAKVNGITTASGTASASIPLVVGDNTITVLVTAQDGVTQSSYTVTVTRVSTVSTLSSLALSAGSLSPAFATGTTTYTASVTSSTIAVTPMVTDSNATVKVNGTTVASGTASDLIPLVVGANPITVLVTAQDGTTQSTYAITVTRISTVSTLSGLALSAGILSPTFATGTTDYMAIVPAATTEVSVTPTVTDPTATIKVDGTAVTSGTASATILIADAQAIAILVTAQDGSTTTYTLTVAFSGYEAWQARAFTDPANLSDPAVSGELATPAQDSITNLMKYALALDPMTCGAPGLPTVAWQDGYLTLTYRKNKTATDVTYTVLAADSLIDDAWNPATIVTSQTDQGDHWVITVQDSVPYAEHPRRFMRLRVGK